MPNPLALPNPLAGLSLPRGRRRQPKQPIDPEVEESLSHLLKRQSLGALATVGNLLDVPGGISRNTQALIGGIGQNRNPFTPILHPFTDEGRTTGRELNGEPNDKTWLGFARGAGREVLTDPLTYTGIGLLTKAGKTAQMAGKLAPKFAARVAAGHASALRLHIPGTNLHYHVGAKGNVGHGLAQAAANKLGQLHEKIAFGNPVGRHLGAMFDASKGGLLEAGNQKKHQQVFARTGKELGKGKLRTIRTVHRLEQEGLTGASHADELVKATAGFPGSYDPTIARLAATSQGRSAKALRRQQHQGSKIKALDDGVVISPKLDPAGNVIKGQIIRTQHVPRFIPASHRPASSAALKTTGPEEMARNPIFMGQMNDKVQINQIFKDPYIHSVLDDARFHPDAKVAAIAHYLENYEMTRYGAGKLKGSKAYKGFDRREELAKYLVRKAKPITRQEGQFPNHPTADLHNYEQRAIVKEQGLRGINERLGELVHSGGSVPGGRTIRSILEQANMNPAQAVERIFEHTGPDVKRIIAKERDRAVAAGKGTTFKELFPQNYRQVMRHRIDADTAKDLLEKSPIFQAPRAESGALKAIDSATSLFKSGMLTHPARYVRDASSGLVQNIITGLSGVRAAHQAKNVMQGADLPGAKNFPHFKGKYATDKHATDEIRRLYAAEGPGAQRIETDIANPGDFGETFDTLLGSMPGRQKSGIAGNVSSVLKTLAGRDPGASWNPLGIHGFNGRTKSSFPPVAAGEKVGQATDTLNRLAPFIEGLRQGHTDPHGLMRQISDAQVNYDPRTFSAFEKTVMKRLFPFYSFTSRQGPFIAKHLAQNPGGSLAQLLRTQNVAQRANEGPLPPHVTQQGAVPLGERQDGTKTFLTGLGLMHEDPMKYLGGNPLLTALSQMNPLIKGPIEGAMGKSTFQQGPNGGRELTEMDPTMARIAANIAGMAGVQDPDKIVAASKKNRLTRVAEQVVANSPISRVLGSVRTATDPRKDAVSKAANLGTGLRVTDVAPNVQDAVLREEAQRLMREGGAKQFLDTYYRQEDLARMSPAERKLAAELTALRTAIAMRAKKRKAEKTLK